MITDDQAEVLRGKTNDDDHRRGVPGVIVAMYALVFGFGMLAHSVTGCHWLAMFGYYHLALLAFFVWHYQARNIIVPRFAARFDRRRHINGFHGTPNATASTFGTITRCSHSSTSLETRNSRTN